MPILLYLASLTDTNNRYFKKCRYIGLTDISVDRYAIPGLIVNPNPSINIDFHNEIFLMQDESASIHFYFYQS